MSVKITSITKSGGYHENQYEAIQFLGWLNEENGKTSRTTREDMYNWIKNENGIAYVIYSKSNKAYLTTAVSARGTKYVKTIADYTTSDNLLELPECK